MSNTKLALSFRIFKNGQLLREDTLTQGVIKIGKVPSAHLRIDDESVSRMHAVLEVTNQEVSLIDLGSTRGTFVNGKKINKARLQSGDVITLGDVRVELAIGDAARPVRRPPVESAAVRPPVVPAAALHRAPALALVPAPALAPVPSTAPAPATALIQAAVSAPLPVTVPAAPVSPATRPATRPDTRSIALPIETTANPVAFQQAIAASADDLGGARAVEVAAMLGDSVIGVKHCMDPRSGKVTPATWGFVAAGAACLLAAAIAFTTSVRNEADNTARRAAWTRVQHKPAYAFRPHQLGAGLDWMAFGGLAFGLVGLTAGLLRMRRERTSPYYRIGTAPGVELAIEQAPLPAFPLVAPSGDDFVFNYGAGIDGELIVDGKSTPLDELAAAGRSRPSPTTAGAIEVPIPPRARIRARAGQATFVVSAVARPRRHATPLFASLQGRVLSYAAGSLALHLGIWALLQMIPPEAEGVNVDIGMIDDTTISARNKASVETPPEKPDEGAEAGGNKSDAAAMALPSGRVGKPDATKKDGHLEVAHTDDSKPHMSREDAIRIAISSGILGTEGMISGVKSVTATADWATGFDTANVNGPIIGSSGEGQGNFGGGIIGDDLGGGCGLPPCGTIGLGGRYDTIGNGPHTGQNYNLLDHGTHGHRHTQNVPVVGQPTTNQDSNYSKSIIRRYIRRHINEISYCYEKQLLAHPDLGGEILVKFLISPSGAVQSASGTGFDSQVSSCLSSVIQSIEFPKPGDGGGVQVNYPFSFHPAGH